MPTLRADENRYLLYATQAEGQAVRRIPGHRYSAPHRCWQFPRQPGVILALDRVFDRDGWSAEGETVRQDVAEARERRYPKPQGEADVKLDSGQLSIGCAINDRDLVKLVPGYRWSPAQKRWYVAAMPLALDVLSEAFGGSLAVEADAQTYIELRRLEEGDQPPRIPEPPTPSVNSLRSQLTLPAESIPDRGPTAPLADRADVSVEETRHGPLRLAPPPAIEQLADALWRIEAKLDALTERLDLVAPSTANPPPLVAAAVEDAPAAEEAPAPAPGDVWALLALVQADPREARDRANRELQTLDEDAEDGPLRAIAGIAAFRLGELDEAFRALSRVLVQPLADARLAEVAEAAYIGTVIGLINDECGPSQPVTTIDDLHERLYAEIVDADGFDDATISGQGSRDALDLLVNDRALVRVSPRLGDYCRVAHLLASARSGSRLALERIEGVLGEASLGADPFALVVILFTNVLLDEKCSNAWTHSWPGSEEDTPLKDGAMLVARVLERVPAIEPALAAHTTLAMLRCIASGPARTASLATRRALLAAIPQKWPFRQYAQFLAAFRLAASGENLNYEEHFPGYGKELASTRLASSAEHLTEVFYSSNQARGAAKVLADGPYLEAFRAWGVTDPAAEVLDLLDFVAAGSRPDNVLNVMGQLVEDGDINGADHFSRKQRKELYRRALAESVRMGHHFDALQAFDRLVRALHDEGAAAELRQLCSDQQQVKALRIPALAVLLEAQLDAGEPFEITARALLSAGRGSEDDREAHDEVMGLAEVFPELAAFVLSEAEAMGNSAEAETDSTPNIAGKHVVLVGGHKWLEHHARPVMEGRWGLRVDWIDPPSSKGGRALALARGGCDLLVVNTACIGHAGSGRVIDAAKTSDTPFVASKARGVGALLTFVSRALIGADEAETAPKKVNEKARSRRKLVR